MNNISTLYENIKNNNETVPDNVHILFSYLEMEQFQKITEGRFTSLFIWKLVGAMIENDGAPKIIDEVMKLEKSSNDKSYLKPETKFKRGKIKGLWHKHYLPSNRQALIQNLIQQLDFKNKDGSLTDYFKKIANKSEISIDEKSSTIADYMVTKQLSDRFQEKRVTGEWIIYHVHNGKNYYLDVSNHTDDEDLLANNIRLVTLSEFPEFKGAIPLFK